MKSMIKHFIFLAGSLFLLNNISFAQEDSGSNRLQYIADYKIAWDALPEWTEIHYEHAIPILEALVEEGVIADWSTWQHNTGSEYNWRLIIDADEWGAFDIFWEEYLGRFPDELSERGGKMIQAHRDQIWEQSDFRILESAPPIPWAYEALFQINFSDMEEWNKNREEIVIPLLEKAMADGILAGWVVDDHNTGDRFNRAEVFLFEEWDDIDDFFEMYLNGLMSDPEIWNSIGEKIQSHDDSIWKRVPREKDEQN